MRREKKHEYYYFLWIRARLVGYFCIGLHTSNIGNKNFYLPLSSIRQFVTLMRPLMDSETGCTGDF